MADSRDSAEAFLRGGGTPADDCRIDAVCLGDILLDFGCSGGEYAMESAAFGRFQSLAELKGVRFEAEPYDGDDSLLVVNIDSGFRRDDNDG